MSVLSVARQPSSSDYAQSERFNERSQSRTIYSALCSIVLSTFNRIPNVNISFRNNIRSDGFGHAQFHAASKQKLFRLEEKPNAKFALKFDQTLLNRSASICRRGTCANSTNPLDAGCVATVTFAENKCSAARPEVARYRPYRTEQVPIVRRQKKGAAAARAMNYYALAQCVSHSN